MLKIPKKNISDRVPKYVKSSYIIGNLYEQICAHKKKKIK